MSSENVETTGTLLALLAPSDASDAQKMDIDINAEQMAAFKFDVLGPMVVNSDGTLSRITNWENMAELERERTMRVLNARNRLRLTSETEKQGSDTSGEAALVSLAVAGL